MSLRFRRKIAKKLRYVRFVNTVTGEVYKNYLPALLSAGGNINEVVKIGLAKENMIKVVHLNRVTA